MAEPERFLLALQGNDEKKFVLEFDSEHYLLGKFEAAKKMKLWVRRLTVEQFESEEYKSAKHYDMGHDVTTRIFYLEPLRLYWMYEDEDSPSS